MALPQCAMAHLGSCFTASENVFSDCKYWKEWSSAAPLSMSGWVDAAHVAGNSTLPRWSSAACRGPADTIAGASKQALRNEAGDNFFIGSASGKPRGFYT